MGYTIGGEWHPRGGTSSESSLAVCLIHFVRGAQSARPAGAKITSCFLCLSVYIFICASALITCAMITSRTFLPCDLASVDFRRLLFVATMSSLAQLRVRDGY